MSVFVPFSDAETEFTEKRSRFISHLWRVSSEAEAQSRIREMKTKYHDARHNCWCYVTEEAARYSDDGEPQGTAGQPMLNVFTREDVGGVCCVITRYFGGVLLGAGGLTRAYAKGAKDVLTAAGLARVQTWQRVTLELPYPLLEPIRRLLSAHGGSVCSADYGETVTCCAELPEASVPAFAAAVTELSAGKLTAIPGETVFRSGAREESR
jgi:uncharacterized YigZ family protein